MTAPHVSAAPREISPAPLADPAATAATPALLELRGLAKRYGEITALHEVTARVTGRIIGLLGPNGAGKSTLLKCLLGIIPFEGQAAVLGISARDNGAAIRDRVGYMPESEAMLMGMSAVELCIYAGQLSGLPRTEAMQRAHAALYFAGLEDKRYQPIESYSTGMKQRVKLAQALVHDPELLFLDEPTNGLDPRAREEMLALISSLPDKRGCSIILSTHLLPDVKQVCDQAVIMHKGRMRFSGTIEELRRNRSGDGEHVIEVKADIGRLAAALTAAGARCEVTSPLSATVTLPASAEVPNGADTRLVFEAARRVGVQVRKLEVRRDSLEAAFLRVIGEAEAPGAAVMVATAAGDVGGDVELGASDDARGAEAESSGDTDGADWEGDS